MKDITITLTPVQAMTIFRIMNSSLLESVTERTLDYLKGEDGRYPNMFEAAQVEFNNSKDGSIWIKLDSALREAGIDPGRFVTPKPILIDNRPVEFRSGHINVGCTTVTNEQVREIAKLLVDAPL